MFSIELPKYVWDKLFFGIVLAAACFAAWAFDWPNDKSQMVLACVAGYYLLMSIEQLCADVHQLRYKPKA
ncbi:hypothetical protein SAMN02990966_05692 [Rhodospirillales bacterium URHD0017]|nr:hypothetical protein SAMN02990966_05692 [Rhodospirillales bacterium URHD0017]